MVVGVIFAQDEKPLHLNSVVDSTKIRRPSFGTDWSSLQNYMCCGKNIRGLNEAIKHAKEAHNADSIGPTLSSSRCGVVSRARRIEEPQLGNLSTASTRSGHPGLPIHMTPSLSSPSYDRQLTQGHLVPTNQPNVVSSPLAGISESAPHNRLGHSHRLAFIPTLSHHQQQQPSAPTMISTRREPNAPLTLFHVSNPTKEHRGPSGETILINSSAVPRRPSQAREEGLQTSTLLACHQHLPSLVRHRSEPCVGGQFSSSASPPSGLSFSAPPPLSSFLSPVRNFSMDVTAKPFFCPIPGCKKSYKNFNGLKYHSIHGHIGDSSITSSEILTRYQKKPLNHHHLNPIQNASIHCIHLETQQKQPSKIYICPFKICRKRYKNLNGVKYHVRHYHKSQI